MIKSFFAPMAIKVFSGVTLALVVALGVAMWRADAISASRDEARKALATEEVRHDVTRASLAGLELRMAELVRDGELREERLREALEQVAKETAPLRKQADQIERGEIDIRTVEGL